MCGGCRQPEPRGSNGPPTTHIYGPRTETFPRFFRAAERAKRSLEQPDGLVAATSRALCPLPHATDDVPSDASQIERIFARCFFESHRTVLVGGGSEPLYQPGRSADTPHRIVYRADFVASALHEVAHWCIAGAERRLLPDYGYWYAPDGRSPAQQREFERVEVKPQALEWLFADAWGWPFELSADNVESATGPSERFARAVAAQRERYRAGGMPARAARFAAALAR